MSIRIATQDAKRSAIWVLADKHEDLRPITIQELDSLSEFKPDVSNICLNKILSIEVN